MSLKKLADAISGKNRTFPDEEGVMVPDRRSDGERFLSSPLGKILAAIFIAMLGFVGAYLHMNLQRLDNLHDSSIRNEALLQQLVKNSQDSAASIQALNGEVQTLKTTVELHRQRLEELEKQNRR